MAAALAAMHSAGREIVVRPLAGVGELALFSHATGGAHAGIVVYQRNLMVNITAWNLGVLRPEQAGRFACARSVLEAEERATPAPARDLFAGGDSASPQ